MSTFALIHGAGDVGWSWHLVEKALRALGHDTVAPDLPSDDDTATLRDYADAVLDAIGDRDDVVVVGHSYGGFTAPLVADRVQARALVLVAAMVPRPGETPAMWWEATGHDAAVAEQAARDGGLTGNADPAVTYFHDVPEVLAAEASRRARGESPAAYDDPWPRHAWPDVPTRFILGTEDRFLPAAFLERVVAERLGIEVERIAAGHYVALSRPDDLATMLARSATHG